MMVVSLKVRNQCVAGIAGFLLALPPLTAFGLDRTDIASRVSRRCTNVVLGDATLATAITSLRLRVEDVCSCVGSRVTAALTDQDVAEMARTNRAPAPSRSSRPNYLADCAEALAR